MPAQELPTVACSVTAACCLRRNLGDGIDYGQRNYDCLGELISDTLALFEQKGGDDAFINIKYMVSARQYGVSSGQHKQ